MRSSVGGMMSGVPQRSIIIIGAGIGGLSTGCYARMHGDPVRIFETGHGPGGVCTSWTRAGYVFDGCIHNLAGSSPSSPFDEIWRDLGVVPECEMYAYNELVQVERPDGAPLTVHANLEQLEAHLKQLAPEDAAAIDALMRAARRFLDFDLLGLALARPADKLKALAKLPLLAKWSRITLEQFAARLRNPFLSRALPTTVYDWPQQPVMVLLNFLAGLHKGDYGWPVGGSAAFARAIERRFLDLGGDISYESPVASVLVENDKAVGVRLADGSEERADIVVSNANGRATIYDMLGGRYRTRAIDKYYSSPVDSVEMGIHVSLGVNRDLSAEPHAIVWPLEQPVTIADQARKHLYVEPFGFDASLAPPNKTPLKVVLRTSYRYWEALYADRARYDDEKRRIGETVVELLEPRFPGLAQQTEVIDVATPITTLQYTGNGPGFEYPPGRLALDIMTGRRLSQTLPGLQNFYMVGQYAGPPSVPLVAAMGRDVARAIAAGRRGS